MSASSVTETVPPLCDTKTLFSPCPSEKRSRVAAPVRADQPEFSRRLPATLALPLDSDWSALQFLHSLHSHTEPFTLNNKVS